MNPHQQQLLQLLQIKTVQLRAEFEQFQPADVISQITHNSQPASAAVEPQQQTTDLQAISQVPAEFSALVADIQQALQYYLPDYGWRWSAQLTQSILVENEIQTPELSILRSKVLKQHLWQLISQHSSAGATTFNAAN